MSGENEPYWKVKQYPLSNGKGAITRWLEKCKQYDSFAELELETLLNTLPALKNEKLWSMPEYRWMTNMEDIGEWRFKSRNKVPLRIFGFFLPDKREHIMLLGAVEDNRKYDPKDALKTALSRRKEILEEIEIPISFSLDEENNDDWNYFEEGEIA